MQNLKRCGVQVLIGAIIILTGWLCFDYFLEVWWACTSKMPSK